MTFKRTLLIAAASALALGGLSACSTSFKADVARFQQLPPAQGQSFTVQPADQRLAGSLEFQHYADLVAQRLTDQGYTRATDPAAAQLVVQLDYDVDRGTQRIRSTGFGRDPFFYDPFFYPGYYRGWRGRYMMGWNDPFLWGPGYNDIESYLVYQSRLNMRINRAADGEPLFEGTARAQSVSNKLTYLVPNLIDALFTGFPGRNGEEVKVTVAPEPRK
ncbi:hypothetical protein SLG_00460 [Sphingobium sp. SYK-6]|uniref:DUF4136 domain-containing protein n=1 Tax=Sphingobium sp. (strain NBRC 103272 / SYK-6) TaxID=627192 RepID=UPI0002276984|nr:DUF4136 domain-containing protein [Sphingobium sp. SYK-6]BAK64721.1 hypothetical protein SLG_00460 [Sphingobium sp. SYK-6]